MNLPFLLLFFLSFIPASGKPAEDEVKLGSLKLKPNTKIMMMGTREESLVGGSVKEKFTDYTHTYY